MSGPDNRSQFSDFEEYSTCIRTSVKPQNKFAHSARVLYGTIYLFV